MTSEQQAADPAPVDEPRPTVDANLADPYAHWQPPPLPISRAFAVGDLRGAVIMAAILTVLGGPAGLLWTLLAPHASAVRSDGVAVYAGFNNEVFIAADATLGAIGLVIGIVAGVAGYAWRGKRGPWMAIGLAVGAAAGSLLAAYLGHQIGLSSFNRLVNSAPAGVEFSVPVNLRATGVLLIEPLVAVLVYVVTAGWSKYGDLRRGDFEIPPEIWPGVDPEPSSDLAGPEAPPAGPAPPSAAGASSPPA
ncbi:DUF2567 domain-containing protein [Fodinicola acaciae]|uniref:DUF2567 domain-containing protein n=1 Tax=Fodinicola acaciae TaxID=2681555 RepID=UPI0013D4E354|nr:DUF2567 domain-containing protein [Fodinicola acaciae]